MVRVSRKRLSKAQFTELITQLTDVVGRLSATQAKNFVSEFLGAEEKEVLAKRLAIVVMLDRAVLPYTIAQQLSVSPTTVGKLCERYEHGEFKQTLLAIKRNKRDYLAFIGTLDSILHLGGILPHYASGRERWEKISPR